MRVQLHRSLTTELSHATVQQNTTLVRKVSALEEEILVWKQARVVLSESFESTKRKYEDEIASLKTRIASIENNGSEVSWNQYPRSPSRLLMVRLLCSYI